MAQRKSPREVKKKSCLNFNLILPKSAIQVNFSISGDPRMGVDYEVIVANTGSTAQKKLTQFIIKKAGFNTGEDLIKDPIIKEELNVVKNKIRDRIKFLIGVEKGRRSFSDIVKEEEIFNVLELNDRR